MGAMFFAVLAVAGQIERNYIRAKTLEGQVIAASKGNHGGRPKVIDDDMLTFAVALKDKGVPVPEIAKKLTIKVGKNAGKSPRSPRCIERSPRPRPPQRTTACRCGPSPSASAAPRTRSPATRQRGMRTEGGGARATRGVDRRYGWHAAGLRDVPRAAALGRSAAAPVLLDRVQVGLVRQYRPYGRGLDLMAAHTIGRGPACPTCGHHLAPGYFTRSDQVFCSGRRRTAASRERERAGSAERAV